MPESRAVSRFGKDRRLQDFCHMSDAEFLAWLRVLEVDAFERRVDEQAVGDAMLLLNVARESGCAPTLH